LTAAVPDKAIVEPLWPTDCGLNIKDSACRRYIWRRFRLISKIGANRRFSRDLRATSINSVPIRLIAPAIAVSTDFGCSPLCIRRAVCGELPAAPGSSPVSNRRLTKRQKIFRRFEVKTGSPAPSFLEWGASSFSLQADSNSGRSGRLFALSLEHHETIKEGSA
jgi:hypothetical protein